MRRGFCDRFDAHPLSLKVSSMAASIHRLARARPARTQLAPVVQGLAKDLPSRIHFWRGASGQRHLCTVYSLYECPPLPSAVYLLVRRAGDGRREVLRVGRAEEEFASLNLAAIRHQSAVLGANEVHVSFSGVDAARRDDLAADLEAAGRRPHQVGDAELHARLN